MMYSLPSFSIAEMTECAAALRREGAGATAMQEAAQRICDYLFRHLGDPETGRHDCVLVRCFVTQTYQQLDPRSQRCAADLGPGHPLPADVKCLTLMGTAGVRPEWNDRERSRRYRSIPLAGRQFVSRLPMFSQLLHQLGVELESDAVDTNLLTNGTDRTFNVFLVPEAHGSPYVPVQDDFVIPYGVASVLGFGAVLAPQVFFTVILFSTQPLTRDTADLFKPLALSVKLALLPFVEHRPDRRVLRVERSPPQWRARAETLEQLLAVHEETVAYHTHQHARAQAARRASEEQYRLLVMQANDIIYRTDRMGRFTFVNPTATRIMQYTDEELVGRRFLELIRADYRPAVERFYGRQFVRKRHNTYYEFPAIAKDGHEVWIGQHVQLLQQDGEVAGFAGGGPRHHRAQAGGRVVAPLRGLRVLRHRPSPEYGLRERRAGSEVRPPQQSGRDAAGLFPRRADRQNRC